MLLGTKSGIVFFSLPDGENKTYWDLSKRVQEIYK